VVVEVVEPEAFDNWINSQRQAAESVAAVGD
jgi:heme/copper-type cytochrome/quinol oxidase subunit 2